MSLSEETTQNIEAFTRKKLADNKKVNVLEIFVVNFSSSALYIT